MSARALRRLLPVAAAVIAALAGCAPTVASQLHWIALPASSFPSGVHGRAVAASALGGDGSGGWLLGGAVFHDDGQHTAAIWHAPMPGGPWTPDVLRPVFGEDGGSDTIRALARFDGHSSALGSVGSPLEGYARPSTWSFADGSWTEVSTPPELFGGPDIVGVGGMAAGAQGFEVAGTWTGDTGAEAAVWHSAAGTNWQRATDLAPNDPAAEVGTTAAAVAAGPAGVLVVGSRNVPTPSNPTGQQPAAWWSASANPATWAAVSMPERADAHLDTVVATRGGWVAGGAWRRQPTSPQLPVVLAFDAAGRAAANLVPLPAPPHGGDVTSLAACGRILLAAGLCAWPCESPRWWPAKVPALVR